MKPISLQQVRQVVGGRALTAMPAAGAEITSISNDTRTMSPGALFVALRAERNGIDFLPDAASRGAVAAVVDQEPAVRLPNMHLLLVPDARLAMGKLARFVRQQMTAKVIAVGGSNGKTGTKNLIDSVLSARLRGTISPKSFNNDIGVPLAIFPAEENQDYLVLEMGTNHHGEIRVLTNMAQPDIAVITNCSAEHLEGLDDLMGVRREEASIIEGLNAKGLLVVNGDDPQLLDAVAAYPGKRVTFGLQTSNDIYATEIRCGLNGVRFQLNGRREVFIPLLGAHTACNALAAIAVARRLGLSEDVIVEALAEAHGPDMRLQLQEYGGVTVLNDAYNANPASMKAGLETLAALPARGRRVAVLGDMREMGLSADRFHREIGQFVASECSPDLLICVGEKAALIAEAARAGGFPADRVSHFIDTASAADVAPAWLGDGDLVLLKGSRYMRLEGIAHALSAPPPLRRVAS